MTIRQTGKKLPPLIIEKYPADYDGYPFITLLQHHKDHYLTIIDNSDDKHVWAYILDLCTQEHINEQQIIFVAREWYYSGNVYRYPISIEFSRRGMTHDVSKIVKIFNIETVTRIIGPLPSFPMKNIIKIKRRKKKLISNNLNINQHIFLGR